MIRIFLIGMLCGVMIMAVVTLRSQFRAKRLSLAMEIFNRGGAAWTFDKNGNMSWKWMVEPIPDTPRQKRVTVPASQAASVPSSSKRRN